MIRRKPGAREHHAAMLVGLRIEGPRFGVWFAVGADGKVVLVLDGSNASWRQFRADCWDVWADEHGFRP